MNVSLTLILLFLFLTYILFVLFSDHGKIIKAVNAESADSNKKVSSVVIEELDILAKSEPIRNLKIVRTMQYGKYSTESNIKLVGPCLVFVML